MIASPRRRRRRKGTPRRGICGLREEMAKTGRTVVDVVPDDGKKRHVYNRPGVKRLVEMAQAGEMDEVWAYRWDRYGKGSVPTRIEENLKNLGVKLRALNDGGDGPGGRYFRAVDGVRGEDEQEEQARKTRMGKEEKARMGRVVGVGRRPRYGFAYVRNHKGKIVAYEVVHDEMKVIRRVLEALAAGESIHAVQAMLDADGVPVPRPNPDKPSGWGRDTIRKMALSDAYRPHSPEELALLVADGLLSQEVHDKLVAEKPYGVEYYGQTKSRFLLDETGERTEERVVESAPRSEWVAVPIPLKGLDRSVVDAARRNVEDNRKSSNAGTREWELSRGFLFCAECGRSMQAVVTRNSKGSVYHYYSCPGFRDARTAAPGRCENRKSHRAEPLEDKAWMLFGSFADPEKLTALYDEREGRVSDEERRGRAAVLAAKLSELESERKGYLRQNARDKLTDSDLDELLAEVDEQREKMASELTLAQRTAATKGQIDTALAAFFEFRQHGDFSYNDSTEERRAAYRRLGARFEVDRGGLLTLKFGLDVAVENTTVDLPFVRNKTILR